MNPFIKAVGNGAWLLLAGAAILTSIRGKKQEDTEFTSGEELMETLKKYAESNKTYEEIFELLKSSMPEINKEKTKKLRARFGNDLVFLDLLDENTEMEKHADSELAENEICRLSRRFGCYDVVITERMYDNSEYDHTDKVPAVNGGRSVLEIQAKHCSADQYRFICDMTASEYSAEILEFIGVAKDDPSISDDMANLFILKEYLGKDYCTEYWYVMTPFGMIEQFEACKDEDDPRKIIWYSQKTLFEDDPITSGQERKYIKAEKAWDFQSLTDRELQMYVPDVYQRSIYSDEPCHIDFDLLKKHGIRFLSFDIDDTIIALENRNIMGHKMSISDKTTALFEQLKSSFKVVLFSNGSEDRVKEVAEKLGIDYIAKAGKPNVDAFRKMQEEFGFAKNEMAHIGNHLVDDVRGGNAFGITTCLVRRRGRFSGLSSKLGLTGNKLLRQVLKERDIWHKHHKYKENDQYYQLGEMPPYKQTQGVSQTQDIADEIAADLIGKIEADKDNTISFDDIIKMEFEDNMNNGMETLRTHLGDDIVFTATLADVEVESELENSELYNGEISGTVFTVGCYTIRNTICLYRDDATISYEERIPADPDKVSKYRRDFDDQLFGGMSGIRAVRAISAKHRDMPEWQDICIAAASFSWQESIDFIGTVKYAASDSDEKEMLFVLKKYIGDSFSTENWYKLSSNGTIIEYQEHPYDPESFEKSWRETV